MDKMSCPRIGMAWQKTAVLLSKQSSHAGVPSSVEAAVVPGPLWVPMLTAALTSIRNSLLDRESGKLIKRLTAVSCTRQWLPCFPTNCRPGSTSQISVRSLRGRNRTCPCRHRHCGGRRSGQRSTPAFLSSWESAAGQERAVGTTQRNQTQSSGPVHPRSWWRQLPYIIYIHIYFLLLTDLIANSYSVLTIQKINNTKNPVLTFNTNSNKIRN
jgi:hypothetical protein